MSNLKNQIQDIIQNGNNPLQIAQVMLFSPAFLALGSIGAVCYGIKEGIEKYMELREKKLNHEIQGLTKSIRNKYKQKYCNIPKKKSVLIIGIGGSGKTTLLNKVFNLNMNISHNWIHGTDNLTLATRYKEYYIYDNSGKDINIENISQDCANLFKDNINSSKVNVIINLVRPQGRMDSYYCLETISKLDIIIINIFMPNNNNLLEDFKKIMENLGSEKIYEKLYQTNNIYNIYAENENDIEGINHIKYVLDICKPKINYEKWLSYQDTGFFSAYYEFKWEETIYSKDFFIHWKNVI